MDVTKPSEIAELLNQHGIKVRKSWGQNFLINPGAVESILAAAALTGKETVLEVGPGLGVMTAPLLARAGEVFAIEIDPLLCRFLRQRFTHQFSPGRDAPWQICSLYPGPAYGKPAYYITSPFLINGEAPQAAIILFSWRQAPYGAPVLLITAPQRLDSAHCREIIMKLGPGNFFPPPR